RHAIEVFLGQPMNVDDVLARTVRLLSQLTQQVALLQYPSTSRSSVQHIEFVPVATRRLLAVVITDAGAVEQSVIDLPDEADEVFVGELRARLNAAVAGSPVAEAPGRLREADQHFAAGRRQLVNVVTGVLAEQLEAR